MYVSCRLMIKHTHRRERKEKNEDKENEAKINKE